METTKKSIVNGVFWTFAERMSAQIVALIVGIVLARILSPSEYGAISLVTVFIAIANVFVTNGFGSALIQKKDADNIDFSTVFYFGVFFSIILYFILFVFAGIIAKFYNLPILKPIIRVLAIKVPISAINSVQQAYVSRKMIFRKFFIATSLGTIISAVVGIFTALRGFGTWALVAQELTNTIVDTFVLWKIVKWRPQKSFSFKRLRDLFSYGWKILLQGLLNSFYGNLRSLLIGKKFSSEELAYYNKGSGYSNLIVTNVDTALSKALFPAMSKEQNDISNIKNMAKKATQMCSYLMAPLLIGFAACADNFVKVLLTEKWISIVIFIRIICICLLVRPAQTAALQAVKATGKSSYVLKMDIPVKIMGVLSLIIACKFGTIYIAISEIITEYFGFLLYGYFCQKLVGYRIIDSIKDLLQNIIPALMMGTVVYGLFIVLNFNALLVLILQIIIGVITYLILSIIQKNESFNSLINILLNFKNSSKKGI